MNEEIICMDTLLSWEHAEIGKIEMSELLELAEKQQKLPMVIEWLLTTACRQFVRWRELGFRPSLLGVSLPISLLQSSPFICHLSQSMRDANFDPAWLLLQIKLRDKAMSFDVLGKSFNMLRYLGVKFAIDDFGSGGLSLWQLKQLPVNYFKLDKALVSDVDTNPQTAILIQSTLELAQNFGVQLIAQGVETQVQLKLLQESGCTLMEGKALGVPLSESEISTQAISES
jgi:EAL domain-containing protein (putative c-di-GMP-specific phosphodiesterase class I)